MKKVFLILALLISYLFLFNTSHIVLGEEASNSAVEKYHISFPITALGNCTSLEACKNYCNDPQNKTACQNYAKTKGFYNQSSIAEVAKLQLGCDYSSTCKEFCALDANKDKCRAFADKYLKLPKINSETKPNNLNTASKAAVCQDFCKSNPQACLGNEQHQPIISSSPGTSFIGPGGCNSSISCFTYCKDHKNECVNFNTKQISPKVTRSFSQLESVCKSSGCTWTNLTCTCQPPSSISTHVATSSGVEGISTGPSLLSKFLNTLFGN